MSVLDGRLKILYPITITSSDNAFAITIDSVQYQLTISAGTYYAYYQSDYTTLNTASASFTTTYPSIYQAIIDAAEAGIAGSTWTVEAVTPAESSEQTDKGIQWQLSPDSFAFTLDFSDGTDWTMDPRIWGYPAGHTTDETSSDTGSLQTLNSDYAYLGCWSPPRVEVSSFGPLERLVGYSTEQMQRADAFVVDYGSRKAREWVHEYIPAAFVYADRASRAQYATNAGIAQGDANNCFEHLFPSYARGQALIIVPVASGTDIHLGVDHTDDWTSGAADQEWELVKIDPRGVSSPVSMTDFVEVMRLGGEYYRTRMPAVQLEDKGSTYSF